MYFAINKKTGKAAIFKEKTALAHYIGTTYTTIYRKLKDEMIEYKDFIIGKADFVQGKSKKGNPNGFKVGFGVKD